MKRITIIAILALSQLTAFAQPTLQECRDMARQNYPEIRKYDLIDKTEGYSLANAAKAWLPQLTLGAQATLQNKVPSFPEQFNTILEQMGTSMPGLRKDQYKVSAELSQTIWDGGKSKADKELAQAEAQQERDEADVDFHALESRVDNLYFGILLLDNNIIQAYAGRQLLEDNLEKLKSLVRNGAALSSDADAVEAELLSVGQTIKQLEHSRDGFRRMLELYIGKEIGDAQLVEPQMLPEEWGEVNRPELATLDAASQKIAAQKKLLDVAVMPHIGLFAQGYYGYPGFDYFASMMSGKWTMNGLVGIKLAWNVSSLYTRQDNLKKLQAAQSKIDLQKDIFLFNVKLQTTQTNSEIERLRSVISDDEKIAALRRNVRQAAESKLRNGVIDTNDLLRKITDETNAQLALNTHRIELLKNIYELNHTVN